MASDILTLNAGSSSLKFSLRRCGTDIEVLELFRGEVEKIGIAPHLTAWEPGGDTVIDKNFGEGSRTRIICAISSPGFRSSAGTRSRRLATASCTAGAPSPRRSASTTR